MQDAELLAKCPSDNEQRFDQRRQVGQVLDSFLMRASNLTVPTMPTLRPKLRRVPRRSLSMAIAFTAQQLGDGSAASAVSDCVTSVTCTGRSSPTRIIWAMPRASLRSVLLICAFNTARMCRVSTQITGKPASASALNSHCDSGSSFRSNAPEAAGGALQHRQHASGSLATLTSRTILPASSTMQTLVSLTETSSPAKWSMLRFSF